MKVNNISFAALLLAVFAVSFLISTTEAAADLNPAGGGGYCGKKCGERCAKAGVLDRCMKYCGICCEKCKCVPSGTYGNKHECPCYRDQRSSKGTPKCP